MISYVNLNRWFTHGNIAVGLILPEGTEKLHSKAAWLDDSIITAAQLMLKEQFPKIGFQIHIAWRINGL